MNHFLKNTLLLPILLMTGCQSETYNTQLELLGITLVEPALIRQVDNGCIEFSLNYLDESFQIGKWVDHSQVELKAVEVGQTISDEERLISIPVSNVEFLPTPTEVSSDALVDISQVLFTKPSFKSTGKACSEDLKDVDFKIPFSLKIYGHVFVKESNVKIDFEKTRFVNPTLTDAIFNSIYDGNVRPLENSDSDDEMIQIPLNLIDLRIERSSYIPPTDSIPLKGMNSIWKQCGIQFQLSQSLELDLNSVQYFSGAPILTQLSSPETFELLKVIKSKIHDPIRSFTVVYGNPGISGFLSGDSGFAIGHKQLLEGLSKHQGIEAGTWSTVVFASDFMRPDVHFELPFATKIQHTAAHEIGHLLIQAGHLTDKGNLMASGSDKLGNNLSKRQCAIARQSATKLLKGETLRSPIKI